MADLYAAADSAAWGNFVPRLRLGFEFDWWAANEVDAGATLAELAVPVLAMLGSDGWLRDHRRAAGEPPVHARG